MSHHSDSQGRPQPRGCERAGASGLSHGERAGRFHGAGSRGPGRRGVVVVQVAICLTVLIGFMALVIDIGHLYNVRMELQRTADAAALAAAKVLGTYGGADPLQAARAEAQDFAYRNRVLGGGVELEVTDVVFGRATLDEATGKYPFVVNEMNPNAVRVHARRTKDSRSGPVGLYFARIFGLSTADVSARAAAVLMPRDIVLVLDLSTSHNDDSSLRSFKNTEIGNRGVWEHLWDEDAGGSYGDRPRDAEGLDCGPALGNMSTWGDNVTGPGWDFTGDGGLVWLPKGGTWNLPGDWVSQTLAAKGHGSYTAEELAGINDSAGDRSSVDYYRRRALVALGICRWKSGMPGGQAGGNGDNVIDENEIEEMVPYPSQADNPETRCKQVGGSWDSFIRYVTNRNSEMCKYQPEYLYYGDPELRYRFGLKTWVDYLQADQFWREVSPGLAGVPQQPMAAVTDAVKGSFRIIHELDGEDLVGLASYGTHGYGPAEEPDDMSWLEPVEEPYQVAAFQELIDRLQPGMYGPLEGDTNIAQGIDKGVEVLFDSPNQRISAAKIMLLLTDGIANRTRAEPTEFDEPQACADALTAAAEARQRGVILYTVSVGANADQELMKRIARPDYDSDDPGEVDGHFHAEGAIETYEEQLREIFEHLGGRRPVMLIE